jgi:hypothetical protein
VNTWETLKALETRVAKCRSAVDRVTLPSPAVSRELVTVVQQELEVDQYDLQEVQATFQNGDLDTIEIWRMAIAVSLREDSNLAASVNKRRPLIRGPIGWQLPTVSEAVVNIADSFKPEIDLRWNYTVGSRQTRYSRDNFCNPDMLVGLDKGKCLDFRTPLVIPRGEQIEFYVQPTSFAMPTSSGSVTPATKRYYIEFLCFGFRRSA